MAEVQVSKEYVREQLHAMGVRNLSEQELESYTRGRICSLNAPCEVFNYSLLMFHLNIFLSMCACTPDFARLIQEHLQHDSSLGTSSGESFGTTSSSNVDSTLGMCIDIT